MGHYSRHIWSRPKSAQVISLGIALLALGRANAFAVPLDTELPKAASSPSLRELYSGPVLQDPGSLPPNPLESPLTAESPLKDALIHALPLGPDALPSGSQLPLAADPPANQGDNPGDTTAPPSACEQSTNDLSLCCPIQENKRHFTENDIAVIGDEYANLTIERINIDEYFKNTVLNDEINQKIDEFLLEENKIQQDNIDRLADRITTLYVESGYINSRAFISQESDFAQGEITIAIVEGRVSEIEVDRQISRGLNLSYLCQRIRLGTGTPLNSGELEDKLRLLRDNPLLENVEATLSGSGEFGASILRVTTTESDPWELGVTLNNYAPPSIGGEQALLNLQHRNISGLGDSIQGGYTRTLAGGNNRWQIGYQVPINALEGTLSFRTEINRSTIVQAPFDRFDIKANSETYELGFRQPLWRSPREEFALSLGLTHRHGQTFLFNNLPTPFGQGPDSRGVSQVSVLQIGQDFVHRDPQGAWGLNSRLNFGLDLLGATENSAPVPDGQFFSWVGQFQRVQRLGRNHLAVIQSELQLTPHTLLPSEQFVIGGGQNLPGYRQNVRSGDNGWRFSLEDRMTLARNSAGVPVFQVIPRVSVGGVWNTPGNPNRLLHQTWLSSAGLGLWWSPVPQWTVQLDYAVPFVNLVDRGENIQDHGLYFNLGYKR